MELLIKIAAGICIFNIVFILARLNAVSKK